MTSANLKGCTDQKKALVLQDVERAVVDIFNRHDVFGSISISVSRPQVVINA